MTKKNIEIDKINITPFIFIENILLVDNLKHNLLSISQFCDKDFKIFLNHPLVLSSVSLMKAKSSLDIGVVTST